MSEITCTPKELPPENQEEAAKVAIEENPCNAPDIVAFSMMTGLSLEKAHIAALTSKYWGPKGVDLSVQFLDNPPNDLRNRILSHANAWGGNGKANVKFRETDGTGDVRIARLPGQGFYSYLGPDIRGIPKNEQTMNLEGFTMQTPDSEFFRVVRHEFGHTLGYPHEHMREAIIKRINPEKAIAWGRQVLRWNRQTVIQQILTPLSEGDLKTPTPADQTSIMAYQLPGSITFDGQPILGGTDINARDAEYTATIYPLTAQPPPGPVDPTDPVTPTPVDLASLWAIIQEFLEWLTKFRGPEAKAAAMRELLSQVQSRG